MPEALSPAQALYMGMEVLIAVSSVIGNVMVVWAVKINKSLRDTTFCFIVSLAVADIAVGACLLVACTVLVLTQSSILALLAIAIDRYLRVKIPTSVNNINIFVSVTGKWSLQNELALQWSCAGLWAFSPTLVITCQFENVISIEYMVYFNFFSWVLLPLLLMLAIYTEIFYMIHKCGGILNKHESSKGYYNKELKLAKSLALVLVLFAASWLPLHILNCITLFSPGCEKPMFLLYIAILLTHGNSAVNPIVYAFRIKKFRTAFQRLWKQYFCCKEAPPIDTQMSERLDKDHFCPGTPLEHNI
uniref:G-protein coupled receptors family 1 profile domain-containing protein n=1 Tax=Electrophorus electricus TaxID=8005 RepID=A0AAY5F3I9_ELEEL